MTAAIIILLTALAVFFLLSRDKSEPAKQGPVQISFYGDSITRGDDLAVRPVVRRTDLALGAFVGVDYSWGGSTVQHAATGDPLLPYTGTFSEWIKKDTSKIAVIGHAGASALSHADKIEEYDTLLTVMINQAKATGKTVVLSGMTWVAYPVPGLSDADSTRILAVLATFDDRTEAIAAREGCVFLDLRSLPFSGVVDMLDNVHPNQDYSDRVSAYVTNKLLELIGTAA